jgi:hypothetical protein
MDMRVDVKIPGGVDAYVIDLRGERYARYHSARSNNILWKPATQT